MLVALLLVGITLRRGLALRRLRRVGAGGRGALLRSHRALARPAVVLVLLGLLGGPASAVWLRGWEPLHTFHGGVGLVAGLLFAATGWLGWQIDRGRSRAVDLHGWLALVAVLAAAVTAVAGFVLLP